MTHFLLEDKKLEDRYDFEITLLHSLNYHNWLTDKKMHTYQIKSLHQLVKEIIEDDYKTEKFQEIIPIGSLQYVDIFTKLIFGNTKDLIVQITKEAYSPEIFKLIYENDNVKPKNLLSLKEWLGRSYEIKTIKEIKNDKKIDNVFIKNLSRYKAINCIKQNGFLSPFSYGMISDLNETDEMAVSNLVEMDSEYRVFVRNGNCLDIKQYSGEYPTFSAIDIEKIQEMITSIQAKIPTLKSYTLDIYQNHKGVFLLELHPLVSCGLYGFINLQEVLPMMIEGYQYYKNQFHSIERNKTT